MSRVFSLPEPNRRLYRICISSLGFSIGGGEIVPIELANKFRTLGHHVTFLALKKDDGQDPPLLRARLRNDIPVVYWDDVGENFPEFLAEYGIEILNSHNVGMELHLFTSGQNINIPLIVSTHGGYETIPDLISKDFIDFLDQNVDEWLYLTEKNIKILVDKGLKSRNFTQVFNAIVSTPIKNMEVVDIRKKFAIDSATRIFVLASRAIIEKGWQIAIDVIIDLQKISGQKFHLLLIGDGPEFNRLKEAYIGENSITFLGRVENPYPIIEQCDFGIFPSTYPGESFPLFLLDCFKFGLPVITTDIGDIPNIMNALGKGMPGIIVPSQLGQEKIKNQMVHELLSLFNDIQRIEIMKRIAKDLSNYFSLGRLVEIYNTCFDKQLISMSQKVFRDPNSLYYTAEQVGTVDFVKPDKTKVYVSGHVLIEKIKKNGLENILVTDRSNRYISGVKINKNGKWHLTISKTEIGNDNECLEIKVSAFGPTNNYLYPLFISPTHLSTYKKFIERLLPENSSDVPTIKKELREIITMATRLPYISHSIHQDIITGNTYQTVEIDGVKLKGGRPSREKYLSQIDFKNKTVLDIGANIGENSRIVRMLGASLVDGYEYDPFFVELGRIINASRGITRVSLFQGDCTRPELYRDMRYDIVLTLAVWVYTEGVMSEIEKITDFLVFETHTLDHGIEFYYQPIQHYFPHIISMGYTEKHVDPHKSRMFFVCGKNLAETNSLVKRNFLKVQPYFNNNFIRKYNNLAKGDVIDLAYSFYQKHKNITNYKGSDYVYGSDTYFEIYLAGLYQFSNNGVIIQNLVESDNLYLSFLQKGIAQKIIDPNLKQVSDNQDWLIRKVSNKYEDALNILNGNIDRTPPVEIVPDPNGNLTFRTIDDQIIKCFIFDGHHRFFMAELVGEEKIHYFISSGRTNLKEE